MWFRCKHFTSHMPSFLKFLIFSLFLTHVSSLSAQSLNAEAFNQGIKSKDNTQIVDIRTYEKFARGHIKYAVNIDFEEDNFENLVTKYYSINTPLYIYAGSDFASNNARVFLNDLGYKNIFTLKGGFSEWVMDSKPYVSELENFEPIAAFTPENFKRALAINPRLFVFLQTPSCGYCKQMKPYMAQQAKNAGYKLLEIDIEENENMSYFFDAHETPTMLIYNYRKQVWKNKGMLKEQELQQVLNRYGV